MTRLLFAILLLCFITAVTVAQPPPPPPVPIATISVVTPQDGGNVKQTFVATGFYAPANLPNSISVTLVDACEEVVATGTATKNQGAWSYTFTDIPKGTGYRVAAYVDCTNPIVFSNVPTFEVK